MKYLPPDFVLFPEKVKIIVFTFDDFLLQQSKSDSLLKIPTTTPTKRYLIIIYN